MSNDSRPTSLYRYYDDAGTMIYVGITSRGTVRNAEHAARMEWWPYVASQEVEHYSSRREASEREKGLIREFRPPFNKQHNVDCDAIREAYIAIAGARESGQHPNFAQAVQKVGRKLPAQVLSQSESAVLVMTDPTYFEVAQHINWEQFRHGRVLVNGIKVGHVSEHRVQGKSVAMVAKLKRSIPNIESAHLRVRYAELKKPHRVEAKHVDLLPFANQEVAA